MIQVAFLLSYTKYGDHDAVLHCFSRENGFESFFARGIYAPKSKKKAFFFPLNELQIVYSEKIKSIKNITKIEQKKSDLFTSDVRKSSILFFISDFLHQILRNENQNEKIYEEILLFLSELQENNFQAHLILMTKILKLQGINPLVSEETYLNPESGTFVKDEYSHVFDKSVSAIWRDVLSNENPYQINLKRDQKQKFLDSLLVYFHYHTPEFRIPKSLEIIQEIF